MKIDFDHFKGAALVDEMFANLDLERKLGIISALKPKLTQDGNQWCYTYGELPKDCLQGFGDTVYNAMDDFVKNFYNEKVKKVELQPGYAIVEVESVKVVSKMGKVPPDYAALRNTVLKRKFVGGEHIYECEAGNWSVGCEWEDNKLVAVIPSIGHLHGAELIEITEIQWKSLK